jgi:hypothetical protein
MDILDEFDINIINWKKDGRWHTLRCCDIKISNTMVHQRINRMTRNHYRNKTIINKRK